MKQFKKLGLVVVTLLLSATMACAAKPNIHILATGGTIAGTGSSATGTSYTAGQVAIGALLDAVPEIKDIANVTGEQIVRIGSQDMEETAYFLNLTVKSDKPVILVGAMRPSTALSADGPLNLYNAVVTAAAKESKDKGVLVAMNGLILGAESVVKMNTVDVQTFQAPNSGALGYVLNGKVFYNQITLKKHTTQSVFDVTRLTSLPKVGIVYSYSNIEADIMTPFLNNGYKGIIHAGVGNGNIHKNIFPSLIDARRKGIVVVRSSRVPTGPTTLDAEVDDAKYQFVASQELNPQKSRVLLMLALTKTTDWKQIQEYFNEY